MSKRCLQLLRETGLLTNHNQVVDISRIDDDSLRNMLSHYYSERRSSIKAEEISRDDPFNGFISSHSARDDVTSLLPSLLVYGHLIADDPVFRISFPTPDSGRILKAAMGATPRDEPDRKKVTETLYYFQELAPTIDAGLLTVLPNALLDIPPKRIPVFFSEDMFRSEVPDHVHDYIHECAIVERVILDKKRSTFRVQKGPITKPCRAIHISFKGDYCTGGDTTYLLPDSEIGEPVPQGASYRVPIEWTFGSSEPLPEHTFKAWVYQSINSSIISRLHHVASEVRLASRLSHSYITESPFEAKLLSLRGFRRDESALDALNFLEANDTLIQVPSPRSVVELRERHPDAFRRFRVSLLSVAEGLRGVPADQFQERAARVFEQEVQPQIDEMRSKIESIKTSVVKGGLVSLGGVALAVATGAAIPLVSAVLYALSGALSETLPAVSEYMQSRKRPEFVWSKLKK